MMHPKEVAYLLQVSESTVRRMAERGEFGAVRVSGMWRFPREMVLKVCRGGASANG